MITIDIFTNKYLENLLAWFDNKNNREFMTTKSLNLEQAKALIKSSNEKKCYVIKKDNTPIGYCMLKEINSNPKIGIMIDEQYQGKGYGHKAMGLLHLQAKKHGCTKIGLMVKTKNITAINLYKKLNYKTTNYIMELDL